jgi:hypothetical protein
MERIGVEDFFAQVLEKVEGLPEGVCQALLEAANSGANPVEPIKRTIREGTRD